MAVRIKTRPNTFISFQPLLCTRCRQAQTVRHSVSKRTEVHAMPEQPSIPNTSGSTANHAQQQKLDRQRDRRPARGQSMKRTVEDRNRGGRFRPGNRRQVDERRSRAVIKHIPRCAHPSTERRTMGGFLMMRIMMGFVRDRLRRGKSPDHKNTDNEKRSEKPFHHALHHSSHSNRTGELMVREAGERVKTVCARITRLTFLVGFVKSLLYTARTILCGRSTSPAGNTLMTRRRPLC